MNTLNDKHPVIEAAERKRLLTQYLSEGKTTEEIKELIPGIEFVKPI